MVYKRCHEKGCRTSPRCDHYWHIDVRFKKQQTKGPVTAFAFLLSPGQQLPRTKTEAELLEAKVLTWVSLGKPAPVVTPEGGQTVAFACAAYRKGWVNDLADKGAKSIMTRIEKALGTQPLTNLWNRTILKDLRDEIVEETSNVNGNRHMARISHMLTWCQVEYGIVLPRPFYHKLANPTGVKKLTEDRRHRRVTDDEILALAAVMDPAMVGLLYAALDTGLRRGELLTLHRDDVQWKHKNGVVLRVRASNAKSGKEREVPVTTDRTRGYLETRRFVLAPFNLSVDMFHNRWENALVDAGLVKGHYVESTRQRKDRVKPCMVRDWVTTYDADLHWHDLRHEFATRLSDAGQPPRQIQHLLGHASIATTERYLGVDLSDIVANMQRINAGR